MDEQRAETSKTINDVSRADAEWRAEAEAEAFDDAAEANALASIITGASSKVARGACDSFGQGEKWEQAVKTWKVRFQDLTCEQLGQAVRAVVKDLDALHLKPTGIEKRLNDGIKPACFGLFTLIKNLSVKLGDPK